METRTVPMESIAELIDLQLAHGNRANLIVTGSSMLPMLHHRRDSVVLAPVGDAAKKGEVILYRRSNGKYILHRVIGLTDGGYICSGDNQAVREFVTREQILAVVVQFTRKGRTCGTGAPGYRLYKALWVGLFPLRRYYLSLRRRLGRLRRKLRRKKNNMPGSEHGVLKQERIGGHKNG